MKRFTFRLSRLLELREAAERNQAGAMGRAAAAEAESALRAEESANRLEAARTQASVSSTGETLAAGMWDAYRLAVEAAHARVEADAQALKVASELRAKEAERFTAARQERQVLERVRERRYAAWGTDAARTEQGLTDEVALRQSAGKGHP